MKATFIDFDDSFSFNVVQELSSVGFDVQVIHWEDYDKNPEEGILVFGPGPGHPDDYIKIFPLLKEWFKEKKPFFGVCLGHQIFWRIQGETVTRSKNPLHGQSVRLNLSSPWKSWLGIEGDVCVQRYNSLAVMASGISHDSNLENFIQDSEILITRSPKVLTYQFHPESVGTTFRTNFMRAIYSIV